MSRRVAVGTLGLLLATAPSASAAPPAQVTLDPGRGVSVTLQPLQQLPPTTVQVPLPQRTPTVPELVTPITKTLRQRTAAPTPAGQATQPPARATSPRASGALSAPAASRAPARSRQPDGARSRTAPASSAARADTPALDRRVADTGSETGPVDQAPAAKAVNKPRTGVLATVVGVLPPWVRVVLGFLGSLALFFGAIWLVNQLRSMRLRRQSGALVRDAGMMKRTLTTRTRKRVGPLLCSVADERADDSDAGRGFHDVFSLSGNRAGVIVGQVLDGGPAPLAQAALMRHRLRAHLELGLPPRSALARADELRKDDRDGSAASATVAVYDGARGLLTYGCAGHATPLVFGPAPDALAPIPHFAPPMGAGDSGFRQTTISLPPNSTACLFSDGVRWEPESPTAMDRKALATVGDDAEEPDAEALLEVVRAGRGELTGDIVICLVRAAVAALAPPRHLEELVVTPDDLAAAHSFLLACGLAPQEAAVVADDAAERAARTGHALLRVSWGPDGPETEIVAYSRDSEWPARPAPALIAHS